MADFVLECTFISQPKQEKQIDRNKGKVVERNATVDLEVHLGGENRDQWLVYVDESLVQEGGDARILLVGPKKEEFKYSIRFRFPVTNNVEEYEALFSGLRLAKKIHAGKIILSQIHSS